MCGATSRPCAGTPNVRAGTPGARGYSQCAQVLPVRAGTPGHARVLPVHMTPIVLGTLKVRDARPREVPRPSCCIRACEVVTSGLCGASLHPEKGVQTPSYPLYSQTRPGPGTPPQPSGAQPTHPHPDPHTCSQSLTHALTCTHTLAHDALWLHETPTEVQALASTQRASRLSDVLIVPAQERWFRSPLPHTHSPSPQCGWPCSPLGSLSGPGHWPRLCLTMHCAH